MIYVHRNCVETSELFLLHNSAAIKLGGCINARGVDGSILLTSIIPEQYFGGDAMNTYDAIMLALAIAGCVFSFVSIIMPRK